MQANTTLWSDIRGRRRLADFLLDAIWAGGASHVFGMPAESLNGIMDAIRKHSDVDVVAVRHEGNAALMASAYGKLSGRLGVCMGTAGPGETHLPIGTYDAASDSSPVLAISGQVPIHQLGSGGFQEIDSAGLFRDSVFSTRTITSVKQTAGVVLACAEALYHHRPTHLAFPNDILRTPLARAPEIRLQPSLLVPLVQGGKDDARRVASKLDAATGAAVVLIGATRECDPAAVELLAERLGAPIVIAPEGHSLLRERLQWPFGVLLTSSEDGVHRLLRHARRVVVVGTITVRTGAYLSAASAVVQLAPRASIAARVLPRSVPLWGNEAELCSQLAVALDAPAAVLDGDGLSAAREEQLRNVPGAGLWRALDREAPEDAVVAVEPGVPLDSALVHFPLRSRTLTSSFGHGVRAYPLAAAVAATVLDAKRSSIAVTTAEGLAEAMPDLLTVRKYGLPVKTICVGGNASIDFAAFGRASGIPSDTTAGDDGLGPALHRLLDGDVPALICVRGFELSEPEPRERVTLASRSNGSSFAAVMVDAFARAGVNRLYGRVRPELAPLVRAARADDRLEIVPVAHPESASMMASANSKWTGRVSVCFAVDGPDLVYQLNGLHDAHYDRSKVVIVTGRGDGRSGQVRPGELLSGLVACSVEVNSSRPASDLEFALREAGRHRDVVHLAVDWSTLDEDAEPLPPSYLAQPPAALRVPARETVREAARELAKASAPVILAGRGALGAGGEIEELASLLQAPIATTMPGRGAVGQSHPAVVGGIGASGHLSAIRALEGCDVLLTLGSSNRGAIFGFRGDFLQIQVDEDPLQLGRRAQRTLSLHGDVRMTVAALIEELKNGARSAGGGRVPRARRQFEAGVTKAAGRRRSKPPILPSSVCHTLRRVLDELGTRAILTVDVGLTTLWVYRHFVGDDDIIWTSSFATMGFALPAAIAVKELVPDRPVIAMTGDGGIGITMSELAGAVARGVPVVAAVFNNGKLGAIKFEQEVMGWPEFEAKLVNCDFAAYARSCGAEGIRVEHPAELAAAFREAITCDKPCVVDILTDPHELPGPPKIHPLQAAGYVVARTREAKLALGARLFNGRAARRG